MSIEDIAKQHGAKEYTIDDIAKKHGAKLSLEKMAKAKGAKREYVNRAEIVREVLSQIPKAETKVIEKTLIQPEKTIVQVEHIDNSAFKKELKKHENELKDIKKNLSFRSSSQASYGGEITKLTQLVDDVKITNPTNNQVLIYNLADKKWENGAGGSSTDEKVKYDASDPTAGYVADKFVAGTGISLSEGTGADENKLKISFSGSSVSFGTTTQLPYMNALGTDFIYSSDLTFDGNKFTTKEGVFTGNEEVTTNISIGNSSNADKTINTGSGYNPVGNTHKIRVYAYKTVGSIKVYSANYTEATYADGGSPAYLQVTGSMTPNVTGNYYSNGFGGYANGSYTITSNIFTGWVLNYSTFVTWQGPSGFGPPDGTYTPGLGASGNAIVATVSSGTPFNIDWTWDAVAGADGYKRSQIKIEQ